MTPPRRLVLDTDVLFSHVYHETYGRLGAEGVVIVIWSEEILAELERVLLEHGRSPRHAEAVCNFVRAGFPDSQVEPKSEDGAGFVSDPADAHVAAAALAGRAEAIVTRNHLDYRTAELLALGIALVHPVDHLTATADAYPTETRSAITARPAPALLRERQPSFSASSADAAMSSSRTASSDPSPAPNQPGEGPTDRPRSQWEGTANPASRGGIPGMGDARLGLATAACRAWGAPLSQRVRRDPGHDLGHAYRHRAARLLESVAKPAAQAAAAPTAPVVARHAIEVMARVAGTSCVLRETANLRLD